MRAAIYARVSSQAQRDRHTIENQLRVLPAFVAAQGWELAGTYIDDGRSAKAGKLEARDGFADLLRDAEARKFELLVVVDVDRLTRTDSIEERARIIGPFQRLGIDIVTPSGGRLDMRTMLGELWITIQALGAAEENRKRAERIKAGKARAIAEGRKPAGPTPFGLDYIRATGTWLVHPEAGPIVREIFTRIAGGESCVAIADDLATRGAIPSPRTGWTRSAVYRIVRKRTACGEWFADKAKGAMIAVPAIVTEEEWLAAARALLAHKKRGLRRTKHVYLLEGLAVCSECGKPVDIRSACGAVGKKSAAAYVCRARKLERACVATIVKCADLDARVWAALCDEIAKPDLADRMVAASAARKNDARDWAGDAAGFRSHLARLERHEVSLMARLRRQMISESTVDVELAAIGRERRMVREQLGTAERAMNATASASSRLHAASSMLTAMRVALPKATPEQRRALLREMVPPRGVVLSRTQALLDLRVLIPEAATSRGDGGEASLALVESIGYRRQHETTLRIRLVA